MKRRLFIFLIIGSGIFLRLWHFSELFYFAIDEEKAAFIIRHIANLAHFPAAGHPSSIGFRLGPLMYYLISPLFALFSPSPIVWGYLGVAVSVLSMILIYRLGSYASPRAGVFSLLLYAFSYFTVLYDRRGWQLTFHSLITLTVLYCLLHIRTGRLRYLYLVTAALIAASQFEVALILLFPFVLTVLILDRTKIPLKHLIICTVLIAMSHIPLFVFDLRHDFLNTRYLLNYFHKDADIRIAENVPLTGIRERYLAHNLIPYTFARMLFAGSDTNAAVQYANCPQYLAYKHTRVSPMALGIVFLLFFWIFIKTIRNNAAPAGKIVRMTGVFFLILFSASALYTYGLDGEMAEYYFLTGTAYFFLTVGILLDRLSRTPWKWASYAVLLFFLWDNSAKIFRSTNPYGYAQKTTAVRWAIEQTNGKPFTLDSFQTCWYSGGYRYLFTLLEKEPVASYMDQYLSEYYPIEDTRTVQYMVTLLTPELVGGNPPGYEEYKRMLLSRSSAHSTFGSIEVYIEHL